jgi:hypothetical protein
MKVPETGISLHWGHTEKPERGRGGSFTTDFEKQQKSSL